MYESKKIKMDKIEQIRELKRISEGITIFEFLKSQELLVQMTAEDSAREEKGFEQEEADFNTSNCLARQKQKEIK